MERMWSMVTWTTFLDSLKSKNKRTTHFVSHLQTPIPCLWKYWNVMPAILCLVFLFTFLESGSWVLSYVQTHGGYKPLRLMKKWKKRKKIDETLPIINKAKHPKKKKKRENTRNKMEGPCLRRHKNRLRWRTTKGTSSSQTPIFGTLAKSGFLKQNPKKSPECLSLLNCSSNVYNDSLKLLDKPKSLVLSQPRMWQR